MLRCCIANIGVGLFPGRVQVHHASEQKVSTSSFEATLKNQLNPMPPFTGQEQPQKGFAGTDHSTHSIRVVEKLHAEVDMVENSDLAPN